MDKKISQKMSCKHATKRGADGIWLCMLYNPDIVNPKDKIIDTIRCSDNIRCPYKLLRGK